MGLVRGSGAFRERVPDATGTLAILDAAYELGGTYETWLRGVAEAMAPFLDEGVGVEAFGVDARGPGGADFIAPLLVGGTDEWQQRWRENWWAPFMESLDAPTRLSLVSTGVCLYAGEAWEVASRGLPTYRAFLEELARSGYGRTLGRFAPDAERPEDDKLFYPDSFNVMAVEPGGLGAVFAANRTQPAREPAPESVRATWAQLAAHLTAALRLRARTTPERAIDGAEAILDGASGRLAHASDAIARDPRLCESTRAALLALVGLKGKRLPDAAVLDVWRALHEGSLSVLERFDHDGRRYYVAHANAPVAGHDALLSRREREVLERLALGLSNKEIGYQLGVTASTVTAYVQRIADKLGVRGRVALVMAARARIAEGEPDEA